jgi:hypothetical protein
VRPRSILGALALVGCVADAPPALTVGPVEFTGSQVLGLTPSRLESLALVTGLGLAVADSTTEELGAPLVETWTQDRLLEILAAELTLEKHGVGDATLMDAYRAEPQWELTVEHLLVFSERWRSEGHREAAAAKAERARALLESGLELRAVEARLSEEPGGEARAGALPPGREGAWVPEFWAAALALEPGELSPVTETQYGFHVLRLEHREVVPFAEARSVVARSSARDLERPAAVLEAWMAAAAAEPGERRAAALAEAQARSLTVPEAERAEILRRWEDQVLEWSTALGFAYGLTPGQVAEAALSALARSGQTADLARRDLTAHSDLIHARYPVSPGTEDAAQS